MLHCLTLNPTPTSPSIPHSYSYPPSPTPSKSQVETGNSTEGDEAPTLNLAHEYSSVVQSNSYNEIRSTIQVHQHQHHDGLLLDQVLRPNRGCVEEALNRAKPNTLTRLVSDYFKHSEDATQLCLLLHTSVLRARALYAPLHQLFELLPADADSESLSQSQCKWAFEVFLQFDAFHNPFPSPDSHNLNQIRGCFSQLKLQLDRRLRKSRSRIRLLCRGSAVSSIAVAVRALASLVAGPSSSCSAFTTTPRPRGVAQLDAAAKGTYVLNNDLDTVDRLVARLHAAIEADKLLVRVGLDSGGERHSIQEVVKQLRKNDLNLLHQLQDLEEHICLCFNTVNRARALLFHEISLHHQTLLLEDGEGREIDDLAANSHQGG